MGYATKIQNLGLDASYENCYQDKKTEENIGTFYLRANYDLTKQTSIGAAYAKTQQMEALRIRINSVVMDSNFLFHMI